MWPWSPWGSPRRSDPPATRTTTPPVEATWSVLKRELAWIHRHRTWLTQGLLRSAIFDYGEGFYDITRIKVRLGYRSPAELEHKADS